MTNKKKLLLGLVGLLAIALIAVCSFLLIKNNAKDDEKAKKDVEVKETNKKEEEPKKEEKRDNKELATPLLYKVTKDGSDNVVYLFGSIHAADDRAYPMRDEIMKAFNDSEYLAVEIDLVAAEKDISGMMNALKPFVVEPGKKLKDYMSAAGYERTIKYMKDRGIYNVAYENYKPAFIYTLLSQAYLEKSGLDATKGIDNYFLKEAYKNNKKIIEYESVTFQYEVLASISPKLAEAMILSVIMAEDATAKGVKDLYEGWLTGDAKKMEEVDGSDDMGEIDKDSALYSDLVKEAQEFNDRLGSNRNVDMVAKTKSFFDEKKDVFVVVGELHIVGDSGIANQMKLAGYNVEQIEYK